LIDIDEKILGINKCNTAYNQMQEHKSQLSEQMHRKSLTKIQCTFMIKALKKPGIESSYINIIKTPINNNLKNT
jgi:hypothetical protein